MDVQDHTTHSTHSGHDGHGVHLCHRCGWPFPNPHPSAKHRRAHKKICGTIEGYTVLIGSEVVSDDEHEHDHEHEHDDDKEKTPSPKVEIKGSFSRSEEEFADAVTEFVDSGTSTGSANKSLDRDLFFSFKDAENAGVTEESNAAPVEISKVDASTEKKDVVASIEVSEKKDPQVEKTEENEIKIVCDSSESNLELTGTGDLVKDGVVGPAPELIHVSKSQEAKASDVAEAGEEKGQETSETITEEAKDSEIAKTTTEVSAVVDGNRDDVKQENFEKLESVTTDEISEDIKQEIKVDSEHVSEVVKESETVEEIKIEKLKFDGEIAPEVVKESPVEDIKTEITPEVVKEPETNDTGCVGEEIKQENFEPDNKHVPEVAKEYETDQTVSVVNEKVDLDAPKEQIQEVVTEPVAVLTETKDLEAPELEKSSSEQIQEAVKEPVAVLTEKEDLGGPHLEKQLIEHAHEVVEKPDSIVTEKDLCTPELEVSSKEEIQEAVKESDPVLTEKEDLGGPHLEKQSNENTHEVVEKLDSFSTANEDLGAPELKECTQENIVEKPDSVLTGKEDLGAHKSETCSNGEATEQKVNIDRNLVADINTETITPKELSDNPVINTKDASVIEDGNEKLKCNQDSGADLTVDSSSHNSLEGTWGSASVLSTASVDAETLQATEKSIVNSGKSNTATSDVFEPPSYTTLVEPKDKDSQQQPNSEASEAGWFPTLTEVNKDSEGRKKNEEEIAKVTNSSTGKQSTPLKNLLGEAKSPSGKQPDPVVQKDEAAVNPSVNDDVLSPPKLIEDGKKGRKKVKGISSWVPFACCSSVNAVK